MPHPIKDNDNAPIYKQLRELLESKIASGELNPGDKIFTEARLAEEFQVSRTTIRRALAGLEKEGIIVRFPGKGTFVNLTIGDQVKDPPFTVGVNFFKSITDNNFYSYVMEGILCEAERRNIHIKTFSSDNRQLYAEELDGLLFSGKLEEDSELYRKISKGILPAVGFNRRINSKVSFIGIDNQAEAEKGVTYLIQQGCRKIGFFGCSPDIPGSSAEARYNGYCDALRKHDLQIAPGQTGFFCSGSRYQAALEYLAHADIDALFVALAPVYPAILHAANTLKISFPSDMKIMVFDDLSQLLLDWPGISYIKMPLQMIGERMLYALRQQLILKDKAPIISEVFQAEIISGN
ncbi:MAG: GntR family transcriptional regulator [Lentisphaeria bacterium]|nr:GntR family transcriptional regulator [Lentisphaeria bacterium]